MSRRLAAILSADVVVRSPQPGGDTTALARLGEDRRALVASELSRHGGRVFAVSAKNVLAEFASVVEAVKCAGALNAGMIARNANIPRNARIHLRIGIDLGDVSVAGETLHGAGIGTARRISRLAKPDGSLVSATAHDQVRDKLDHGFKSAGKVEAGRGKPPVRVFRPVPGRRRPVAQRFSATRQLQNAAAVTSVCAITGLAALAGAQWQSRVMATDGSELDRTDKAAIAFEPDLVDRVVEVAFWNTIREADDRDAFEAYIDRYPDGQFAKVARTSLNAMAAEAPARPVDARPEANAGRPNNVATAWQTRFLTQIRRQVRAEVQAARAPGLADWRAIRTSLEPVVLQKYLIRYPNGAYVALARDQMETAKARQMANLEADRLAPHPSEDQADDELTEAGRALLVQQHLARLGCNPGRPDGIWGSASERALQRFARHSDTQLVKTEPNDETLEALGKHSSLVCPLDCGPRQVPSGNTCVLKTCDQGLELNRSGVCVSKDQRPKDQSDQKTVTSENDGTSGKQCGRCMTSRVSALTMHTGVTGSFPIICGRRYEYLNSLGHCE